MLPSGWELVLLTPSESFSESISGVSKYRRRWVGRGEYADDVRIRAMARNENDKTNLSTHIRLIKHTM